jgi:hypothetical protein
VYKEKKGVGAAYKRGDTSGGMTYYTSTGPVPPDGRTQAACLTAVVGVVPAWPGGYIGSSCFKELERRWGIRVILIICAVRPSSPQAPTVTKPKDPNSREKG